MKKLLISDAIKSSLDELARLEQYNSNLYHALSNYAQSCGLFGTAKKFASEAIEEVKHFQDVAEFVNQRGGCVMPMMISEPVISATTLKGMIESAYLQEVLTESAYKSLGSLALSEADHVTYQFVHEVLEHQSQSVGEYGDLIARCEMTGDEPSAILLIDQELGSAQ